MVGPMHRVEKVDPAVAWPDGARGFSSWLIENVDMLNEHLPFDLIRDSLTHSGAIDDAALDVVGDAADAATGDAIKVVVQHQLSRTDHDHLGKVVASAAACDARAAVWISTGATALHAEAVQWINDESTLDAWLFDVEVIRIGDSPPAAVLTEIVGPATPLEEDDALKRKTRSESLAREDFWAVALPKVIARCRPLEVWQALRPHPGDHYSELVPDSPTAVMWQMWVGPRGSSVSLRADGGPLEHAQFYFRQLLAARPQIDDAFAGHLHWKLRAPARTLQVRWDNPVAAGYKDDPASWGQATDLLADAMARLVEATKERIQALEPYPS